MNALPISLAAATGVAATFNPCGVGLLPSYVGLLVGRPAGGTWRTAVSEGLAVGVAMTGGLLLLFAGVAAGFEAVAAVVLPRLPFAGVGVGVAIALWGAAIVVDPRRFLLSVRLPHVPAGVRRGAAGAAVYGLAYGLASLGCTFPLFIALLAEAASAGGPLGVAATVLAYALGMGACLSALAILSRAARGALQRLLTVGAAGAARTAGVLVFASGAFVVAYWSGWIAV